MRRLRGFTLVEIMIVVLIIGILLAIAVPQWMRARENAQQKGCISNLRMLDQAQELSAYQNGLKTGDPVDSVDAWTTYAKGPYPTCPAGGTYTAGVVGTTPTCSLSGPQNHVYNP